MARQKLEEKRLKRFSVYCTKEEVKQIEKYAADANTNPTEYLRRAGLKSENAKAVTPRLDRDKWIELGKLHGLLNQIAKGINIGAVQNVNLELLNQIKSEVQKLRLELLKTKEEK